MSIATDRELHLALPPGFRRRIALIQWACIVVNAAMVVFDIVTFGWPNWWMAPNLVAGGYCCYIRGATAGYWRRTFLPGGPA